MTGAPARKAPRARGRVQRFVHLFWSGPLFGVSYWGALDLPLYFQGRSDGPTAVANLFFCLLIGSLLGVLLGVVWVAQLGCLPPVTAMLRALERMRAWLTPHDPDYAKRLAWLYALPLLLLGWTQLAVSSIRALLPSVANADNLALSIVLCLLVQALALLALARPVQRATLWFLRRFAARLVRSRPSFHVCMSLLLSGLLGYLAFGHFLEVLGRLHWEPIIVTFAALAGALAVNVALTIAPNKLHSGLAIGSVASLAVSGIIGAQHTPPVHANQGSKSALAQAGFALVVELIDIDGDDHIHLFGGNDCDPRDAAIHPGAQDVPTNGTDEDCDGGDAVPAVARATLPRRAFRLPSTWSAQPDLYLITIDAFSPSVLQQYSGRRVAENLERLAERSVVFDHFFVQGPSTRLSLPSMFTSRFDSHIERAVEGRFPYRLLDSNLTLAEVLTQVGYETAAILPDPYFLPKNWGGLTQGFRVIDPRPALAARDGTAHTARLVSDRALEVLTKPRSDPLFLWVHYFDAHPPHEIPQDTRPDSLRTEFDSYAAEVSHLDRELGRLLERIQTRQRDYFIILTGDHGIAFDPPRHEHEHYGQDLSTLVLHVPLMVYSPKLTPRRVPALASGLDIAPTTVNLSGGSPPISFQGHSLVPSLLGNDNELPETRFAQFYISEDILRGKHPLRMVSARTARYNMVLDRRSGLIQAWDWKRDPSEQSELWQGNGGQLMQTASGKGDADLLQLVELKRQLDRFVSESTRRAK